MMTVFFDWGGVVADDPGDDFLTELMLKLGLSREQIHEIFKTYMADFMRGNITEEKYWQELEAYYDIVVPSSISEEFKKWNGLKPNGQILDLINWTKNHGCQTALLTNVIRPTYNVLKAAGYYNFFDQIIASCDEGLAKPDQEFYDLALKRLHTTAKDSVFIDDKKRNLDPAEKMGFKVILAENPEQIIREVRAALA